MGVEILPGKQTMSRRGQAGDDAVLRVLEGGGGSLSSAGTPYMRGWPLPSPP